MKRKDDKNYEYAKVEGAYSSKASSSYRTERFKCSGAMLDSKTKRHNKESLKKEAHRLGPCKFCHKIGHTEEKCFKKRDLNNQGHFYNEFRTGYTSKGFAASSCSEVTEFLVDTAATSHICAVRDWFKNFRTLSPAEVLVGDKNSTSKVMGIGDVELI